jgi:hypothetical protein
MDEPDERNHVPENAEQAPALTTEQMLELLTQRGGADQAYRISEAYEHVERAYNASLSVGTFSASAASTNPR